MLSAYRGNAAATSPQASNKAIAVEFSDAIILLADGVSAGSVTTEAGIAKIFVDSADGDLKIKFGDGTIKTIATDTP